MPFASSLTAYSRARTNCSLHELASDATSISQDNNWKSFLLAGYGFRSWNNIELCPDTWRICRNIPGLITVMFSIMEPGKHLPPYYGIDSVPVIWVAIPRNRH